MKDYEGLFILKPGLKDEEIKNVIKSISGSIAKAGGDIKKEENWGKRQLAYPIKKVSQAYYYKVDFASETSAISKLEAGYKLNSDILRMMITRKGV